MTVRVGINGFGRMGRLALRAGWNCPDIEFVHINEPAGPVESAAHLLEFDSVHGRWRHEITTGSGRLMVDAKAVGYSSSRDVGEATWRDAGVDIVLEASGKWRTVGELSPYLAAGVKKVIVAAPVKGGDTLNIVMGVNDHLYDPARHDIVTAASCTTNCLAPVVKVVHEAIGIAHGQITTIHSSTNTQSVHDQMHKDLRRARFQPVAGTDDDRFGDRDRADLPGTERQARRARGACAAAQRIAYRLRLRDAACDDRRRGQWPAPGGRGGAAQGNSRLRGAAAGVDRPLWGSALGDR